MTKLLDRAIAEVQRLPDDRQDELAAILMEIACVDPESYKLSPEQIADLEERLAAPPDYATEEETAALIARLTQ
jgi:hypothetical protein